MQPGPVLSARLQKLVDLGLTLALDKESTLMQGYLANHANK